MRVSGRRGERHWSAVLTFSVPFGTAVTYVGIWLKLVPSFSNPSATRGLAAVSLFATGLIGEPTHLAQELLDALIHILVCVLELGNDGLGLGGESHA